MTLSIDLGLPGLTDVSEIGRGGFGVVYRARQASVGRTVAVKMLATVSLSDETRRRFERECKAMAAVSSHPNIIAMYDSGMTASGRPYIVMEYAPGGALSARLPLPWQRAVEVAVKMAGALETAHQIGIVHRDVKPENILLSTYGEPKLTDFGVAKVAESSETPSGNITASILHAAPETLSGARPSATTDVYSLASTVFALIAGRAPFAGDNEETLAPLLTRIMLADTPDLQPYDVPAAICAAIDQALAKDPAERPQSPADFGRMLAAAQQACGLTPTEMLIEGVERTGVSTVVPANGKDDRSTQRRNRESIAAALPEIPVQGSSPSKSAPQATSSAMSDGVGSDPETVNPGGNRKRIVVVAGIAAAALVAGTAAVVLTGGSSSPRHPSSPTAVKPVDLSASYAFADAQRGVLMASRSWALDATGRTVSSTTEIHNNGSKALRVTDLEVIPKSIATNVATVTFSRKPTHVIQSDPVVEFGVIVRPHGTVVIRWTARLAAPAQPTLLSEAAAAKKVAEKTLTGQLPTLARRWGFATGAVLPFATALDPGLKRKPVPSPSASSTATTAGGGGATSAPTTTGTSTAAVANRAPTLTSIGSRSVNELSSVSVQLSGHDPEGASPTYVHVSGSLPSWLSLNSRTGLISGRAPYNAVNKTTDYGHIASSTYSIRFAASDGHKQSSAQTLTLTVRDTYRAMPNYYHKFGDGSAAEGGIPSLGNLLTPANRDFRCHIGTSAEDASWSAGQVYKQYVPAGTIVKWGGTSPMRFDFYYKSTSTCG
jgi:serine/threonine protein kinase